MIKNERQLALSKRQLSNFVSAKQVLEKDISCVTDDSEWIYDIQLNSIDSHIAELNNEIDRYEALKNQEISVAPISSLSDISRFLIELRIYKGLTHQQFADLLGMKEQQIQRYEANNYDSISLNRLVEFYNILNEYDSNIAPDIEDDNSIVKELESMGFSKSFIRRRLISHYDVKARTTHDTISLRRILGRIRELSFGFFGDDIYDMSTYPFASAVNFKNKIHSIASDSYTMYTHYIVAITLDCIKSHNDYQPPSDPEAFAKDFYEDHNELTFASLLEFLWKRGIPVVPLNDEGAFHGACFTLNGKSAIVLKQKYYSIDRWLFDLLHEIYHVSRAPLTGNIVVLDYEQRNSACSDEENRANWFAGWVLFNAALMISLSK